LFGLQII
jgi:hypothetical protein